VALIFYQSWPTFGAGQKTAKCRLGATGYMAALSQKPLHAYPVFFQSSALAIPANAE